MDTDSEDELLSVRKARMKRKLEEPASKPEAPAAAASDAPAQKLDSVPKKQKKASQPKPKKPKKPKEPKEPKEPKLKKHEVVLLQICAALGLDVLNLSKTTVDKFKLPERGVKELENRLRDKGRCAWFDHSGRATEDMPEDLKVSLEAAQAYITQGQATGPLEAIARIVQESQTAEGKVPESAVFAACLLLIGSKEDYSKPPFPHMDFVPVFISKILDLVVNIEWNSVRGEHLDMSCMAHIDLASDANDVLVRVRTALKDYEKAREVQVRDARFPPCHRAFRVADLLLSLAGILRDAEAAQQDRKFEPFFDVKEEKQQYSHLEALHALLSEMQPGKRGVDDLRVEEGAIKLALLAWHYRCEQVSLRPSPENSQAEEDLHNVRDRKGLFCTDFFVRLLLGEVTWQEFIMPAQGYRWAGVLSSAVLGPKLEVLIETQIETQPVDKQITIFDMHTAFPDLFHMFRILTEWDAPQAAHRLAEALHENGLLPCLHNPQPSVYRMSIELPGVSPLLSEIRSNRYDVVKYSAMPLTSDALDKYTFQFLGMFNRLLSDEPHDIPAQEDLIQDVECLAVMKALMNRDGVTSAHQITRISSSDLHDLYDLLFKSYIYKAQGVTERGLYTLLKELLLNAFHILFGLPILPKGQAFLVEKLNTNEVRKPDYYLEFPCPNTEFEHMMWAGKRFGGIFREARKMKEIPQYRTVEDFSGFILDLNARVEATDSSPCELQVVYRPDKPKKENLLNAVFSELAGIGSDLDARHGGHSYFHRGDANTVLLHTLLPEVGKGPMSICANYGPHHKHEDGTRSCCMRIVAVPYTLGIERKKHHAKMTKYVDLAVLYRRWNSSFHTIEQSFSYHPYGFQDAKRLLPERTIEQIVAAILPSRAKDQDRPHPVRHDECAELFQHLLEKGIEKKAQGKPLNFSEKMVLIYDPLRDCPSDEFAGIMSVLDTKMTGSSIKASPNLIKSVTAHQTESHEVVKAKVTLPPPCGGEPIEVTIELDERLSPYAEQAESMEPDESFWVFDVVPDMGEAGPLWISRIAAFQSHPETFFTTRDLCREERLKMLHLMHRLGVPIRDLAKFVRLASEANEKVKVLTPEEEKTIKLLRNFGPVQIVRAILGSPKDPSNMLELLAEFLTHDSVQTSVCSACGITITNEESVSNNMGPICFAAYQKSTRAAAMDADTMPTTDTLAMDAANTPTDS